MSTTAIELPLFPLNVVLFPGTALPLYIFEPRYRQMIADCQRDDRPFGIVLAKPESEYLQEIPYSVGTMAEMHHLDQMPDGRYTLIAIGTRRFRILDELYDKPYLSALVELFDDAEPEPELVSCLEQTRSLFQSYINMLLEVANEKSVKMQLPEEPEDFSYCVAYFMDIQNEPKQHLLELTSTLLRLQDEAAILHREVPFMRQILSKNLPEEQSMLN